MPHEELPNLGPLSDATLPPGEAPAEPEAKPAPLGAAELAALDTMMSAFLADGKLDPAELVAYQAARTAFTAGAKAPPPEAQSQDTPPLTDAAAGVAAYQQTELDPFKSHAAKPAAAGARAAKPAEGLAGAITDYRRALMAGDVDSVGHQVASLAGLVGSKSHQIHFLPDFMIPHGIRVLSWAAVDREPTAEELKVAQDLVESHDPTQGVKVVVKHMLELADDPAAAAVKLVWESPAPSEKDADSDAGAGEEAEAEKAAPAWPVPVKSVAGKQPAPRANP